MPKTLFKRAGLITPLVIITIFLFLMIFSAAASAAMLGDVNNDGFINIQDVVLVQKHVLGFTPPLTDAQKIVADVNGDGVINILDVTLITQMSLGLINEFPILATPVLSSPVDNTFIATTSIIFQWNPSSGANKYELEVIRVSDSAIFRNQVLGNVTSSMQFGFPNDDTQFRWRVRAGNEVGWGVWSGYRNLTNGTIATIPATMVLFSPADNANTLSTSIMFEWKLTSGANKYELEVTRVSDSVVFKNPVLGNVSASIQTGFPGTGTQYKWRVRAGNEVGWGTWSGYRILNNGTMSTLPAAPILLSPADNATAAAASIIFQWNPSSGANKYELEVTRVSDGTVFKNPVLGNFTSSTQNDFPNDGTQFRWRVRAGNDAGWGVWSGYRNLTNGTILTIPTAPVLFSPADTTNVFSTSIMFEWKLTSGANNYELEVTRVSDSVVFKNPVLGNVTSSIQFGFPNDGTQYKWRVRAGNDAGWGAWSGYRILNNGVLPDAPSLSSPADNAYASGISVSFQWTASSGSNKYQLEVTRVSDGAVFMNPLLGNVTFTKQTGFFDDGTQYRWRVRAGSNDGWGVWSGYRIFTNGVVPVAPELFSPADNVNTYSNSITFEWKFTSGANKYELEIRNSDDTLFRTVTLGNVSASMQTGFPDNALYKWRVRAGNDAGWGAWSNYRNITKGNLLAAPALILPYETSTVPDTSITFEWAASSGANKYQLEVIRVSDGAVIKNQVLDPLVPVTTTTQTGFSDDGTQYRWRVRAGNDIGWGAWSGYRNFINETILDTAPVAPVMSTPDDDTLVSGTSVTFVWEAPIGTIIEYQLQVIRASDGAVIKNQVLTGITTTQTGFPDDGTQYRWRVRVSNATGWGNWSFYTNFTNGFWWLSW